MREIQPPFAKKPVSPGSLKDIKVLLVGNEEYCDGIVAYYSSQMGFSQKNFIHFLECEKPGSSPEEINPDLVIVIRNRQDETDEVTRPRLRGRYYDSIIDPVTSQTKQVWNHAFEKYSLRTFSCLWNFWNKYHAYLKTKPCLEVEFTSETLDKNVVKNSECVELKYHPAQKADTIRLLSHLKSFTYFFKKGEAYGTNFNNNEEIPFRVFEQYPFPMNIAV